MARRILADPVAARQQAAAQLRTLLNRFDLAELQAQTYAPTLVDMLAGMAMDVTIRREDLPVLEFRAKMAQAVLARAYGQPATKASVTVHRAEDLAPSSAVQQDVEAAKTAAHEFQEISHYMQLPMEQWPDWLKQRFEQSGTAYQVIEDGGAAGTGRDSAV